MRSVAPSRCRSYSRSLLSCDDESDIVRTLTGGLTAVKVQIQESIGRRTLDARTILFTVSGAVDRRLALDLQRAIGQAVRCGRLRAIVELSGAGRIEPGVIAVLLHARRRLLTIGGELTVVAPGEPFGLASPLPIAPTVEAAQARPHFASTRRAVIEAGGPTRRAPDPGGVGA